MTPADRCDACHGGCRSLTACRVRCGLTLEPGRDIAVTAPASRVRRSIENAITGAAILTGPSLSALSLWLVGAFAP